MRRDRSRRRSPRERADGERADGERADGERADGERADGERADGERADGERADRERACAIRWRASSSSTSCRARSTRTTASSFRIDGKKYTFPGSLGLAPEWGRDARLVRRRVPALGLGLRAGARRRRRRQADDLDPRRQPRAAPGGQRAAPLHRPRGDVLRQRVRPQPAALPLPVAGQDQRRAGVRRFAGRLPDDRRRLVRRRLRRPQGRTAASATAATARPGTVIAEHTSIDEDASPVFLPKSSVDVIGRVVAGRFSCSPRPARAGWARSTAPAI